MLRTMPLIAALLFAPAAMAQTPAAEARPKVVKAQVTLRNGAMVHIVQPDIVDRKVCGYVRAADAPANTTWKKDCIATSDVADVGVEGAKHALAESIDGSMCMVLMPLCLAKVSAVQDRIVEKAIAKAEARAAVR